MFISFYRPFLELTDISGGRLCVKQLRVEIVELCTYLVLLIGMSQCSCIRIIIIAPESVIKLKASYNIITNFNMVYIMTSLVTVS